MPYERHRGRDQILTFGTMDTNWISFRVNDTTSKADAKSADSGFNQRVDIHEDCSITLRGWSTENAAGYTFAEVQALKGKAPSAFTWTNAAGTPVSMLRSDFFDDYPLSGWRVDDVTCEASDQPLTWELTMSPNNLSAPKS